MIASLRLQNFRSYADASFEFAGGVNIIVGPNGSGKTNLLEALLLLSRGNTYRGHSSQTVQHDKDWARLDAVTDKDDTRSLKLRLDGENINKEFKIGGNNKKRLTAATMLPVVIFEPNHLQLISGEPNLRRDFLDEMATHLLPAAAINNRAYRRAVSQRNALLKQTTAQDRFFVWDVRLAELAEGIVKLRLEAIAAINKRLLSIYRELGGHADSLEAVYISNLKTERYGEQLMKYLNEHFEIDTKRGFTGAGPHRDDLMFLFDGVDARSRASRGEIRTMLLALKIIEIELASRQAEPMLLLDDVFSELDGRRRKALAERLKGYQTFITTTDADVAVANFQKNANVIPLNS